MSRRFLPLLVGALSLSGAATASAHAVWMTPTPRSSRSDLKDPYGPCGDIPRTATSTMYTAGQTIDISWTETVNHPGCFLVDFSTENDGNWMLLKNIPHSAAGGTPRDYSTQVTLPAGVGCTACTLRLRQIMLSADTDPCPPTPIAMGSTYYSCADVSIPAPTVVDMAMPMPPQPTPGGATEAGCQVAAVDSAGLRVGVLSQLSLILLAVVTLLLRRRRSL